MQFISRFTYRVTISPKIFVQTGMEISFQNGILTAKFCVIFSQLLLNLQKICKIALSKFRKISQLSVKSGLGKRIRDCSLSGQIQSCPDKSWSPCTYHTKMKSRKRKQYIKLDVSISYHRALMHLKNFPNMVSMLQIQALSVCLWTVIVIQKLR